MDDVHVNRQEGERDGGSERGGGGGGAYFDNQQVTEAQRSYNQQVGESVCEREFVLESTGRGKQGWAGDSGGRRRTGGDGCVLTYTQHTHMSIGNRKTCILYARAMVGYLAVIKDIVLDLKTGLENSNPGSQSYPHACSHTTSHTNSLTLSPPAPACFTRMLSDQGVDGRARARVRSEGS